MVWHSQLKQVLLQYGCFFVFSALVCTRVNDGVLFIEGNPRVPPFPLRPLDFQVAFLNGEKGDALVVSCVELCQILAGCRQRKNMLNVAALI